MVLAVMKFGWVLSNPPFAEKIMVPPSKNTQIKSIPARDGDTV